jgi:hypothetical protein
LRPVKQEDGPIGGFFAAPKTPANASLFAPLKASVRWQHASWIFEPFEFVLKREGNCCEFPEPVHDHTLPFPNDALVKHPLAA